MTYEFWQSFLTGAIKIVATYFFTLTLIAIVPYTFSRHWENLRRHDREGFPILNPKTEDSTFQMSIPQLLQNPTGQAFHHVDLKSEPTGIPIDQLTTESIEPTGFRFHGQPQKCPLTSEASLPLTHSRSTLRQLPLKQLRKLASARSIPRYSSMPKAKLIELLSA
jgi:hypothetical protein